jgi:hypothetical protein
LPHDEVTVILKQLLVGRGQQAESTLKNRFAAWRRSLRGDRSEVPRRTVGELWKRAELAEKIRLEKEEREQERREIKRRKEHEAYLKALAENFPKAWKSVQQSVERRSGLAYKEACRALADLSQAYSLHGSPKIFEQELRKFMVPHMRRKALIQRLVKAGIWHEK